MSKNRYGVDEDHFRQVATEQATRFAAYAWPDSPSRQAEYVAREVRRSVLEHCYPVGNTCPCCGRFTYTKEWADYLGTHNGYQRTA